MTRHAVQSTPGAYYHIYNRGAHKRSLVCDDGDYLRLLKLLKKYSLLLHISVVAYCLMPNHYHWLVRQDGDAAVRCLVQRVFNAYSHAFNMRRQHSGTLFEGPYKAILVESDEYLHQLCFYIHANPVRHGFAADPSLWPYSNYSEWIGARNGTLIDKKFVREHFPAEGYKAYMLSYIRGQVVLPGALGEYLQELDAE